MSERKLVVLPDDVGPPVLEERQRCDDGAELAASIRKHLQEKQPWLARRVRLIPREHDCIVRPDVSEDARRGERPLDILRAVQGTLGMVDKLPEVENAEGIPEIEVDEGFLVPEGDEARCPQPSESELISNRVRYFPLPEAAWYEICDGTLTLTTRAITFQPYYFLDQQEERDSRKHAIAISDIHEVHRDTWCRVPCLRVETSRHAYRYGWPGKRESSRDEFLPGEWMTRIQELLG